MKKNVLNLFIALLTTAVVISSCTKDSFPPSLSLDIEPYVMYYGDGDMKYTLYRDTIINGDTTIFFDKELYNSVRNGDIQSYIDLNSLGTTVSEKLKYVADDNGEFWTKGYLNEDFKYPGYRVSGYGDGTPSVSVTFDDGVGLVDPNTGIIDLGKATSTANPYYTFTYTANDDGEVTTKKVHLRVYNSYYNLSGLYISCASAIKDRKDNTLWLGNMEKMKTEVMLLRFLN